MTSQLRHHYIVLMGHFTIFQVTQIIRMIRAKNYEYLSNCVKVTAKLLLVPFFQTWCVCKMLVVVIRS